MSRRFPTEDAVRSAIGQGTNAFSLSHIGRYVAALRTGEASLT